MKVVSLFSGAGGLDLGFKMAGHEIVWANDLYSDAVETYRKTLAIILSLKIYPKLTRMIYRRAILSLEGSPVRDFL